MGGAALETLKPIFVHLQAQELLYLMCSKGDVSVLVRMEQTVLRVLNFQVQVADPIFFLSRLMLYDENGESEQVSSQLSVSFTNI